MGLSRRVLADGEEVVYQCRPHWLALGGPVAAVLAVAAALVAVTVAAPGTPVGVAEALAAVGGVAVLWFGWRYLRWRHTIVAVTTMRVIERTGVLSRRGEEIRLDRIAELTYHQSLLGVVFGAGRLVVDTGAGGRAVLDDVRRPARLQSVITDQITAYQRWLSAPAPNGADRARAPGRAVDDAAWWWPSTAGGVPAGPGPAGPGPDAAAPGWATPPHGIAVGTGRPGGAAPPAEGPPGRSSVADRLATLRDLHLRGLVSDQEYEAKRAKLLELL